MLLLFYDRNDCQRVVVSDSGWLWFIALMSAHKYIKRSAFSTSCLTVYAAAAAAATAAAAAAGKQNLNQSRRL